jgi:hypothetical protein
MTSQGGPAQAIDELTDCIRFVRMCLASREYRSDNDKVMLTKALELILIDALPYWWSGDTGQAVFEA